MFKFDILLKKFLTDQSTRPANVGLAELNIFGYSTVFEQFKPEVKQEKIKAEKQQKVEKIIEGKEPERKEVTSNILKKPQKHYSLEQFID